MIILFPEKIKFPNGGTIHYAKAIDKRNNLSLFRTTGQLPSKTKRSGAPNHVVSVVSELLPFIVPDLEKRKIIAPV